MSIPQRIKDLANKVRNEIYGKDVRESIAQSMEITGETAENAKKRSIEQTDRVDTLIKENPQPSEVVDARLGHPTLRDKLNSTDQQLAHKAEEIEQIENKKMDKNTTNIGLFQLDKNKGLIDETWVADSFKQQMAGNTPIHSVPERNSILRKHLVNKAAYPENLSFVEKSSNLFNIDRFTKGYVDSTTGLIKNDQYGVTDFIFVEASQPYITKYVTRTFFYDEAVNYISDTTSGQFNTPDNAMFIRSNIDLRYVESAQINKGNTLLPFEPFYERTQEDNDLIIVPSARSVKRGAFEAGAVTPKDTSFFESSNNLFNKNDVRLDTTVTLDGDIVENSNRVLSDFIPVLPNWDYSKTPSHTANVAEFTRNKKYIKTLSLGENSMSFKTSPHTYYLLVAPTKAIHETFMLNEGKVALPYEDYKFVLKSTKKNPIEIEGVSQSEPPGDSTHFIQDPIPVDWYESTLFDSYVGTDKSHVYNVTASDVDAYLTNLTNDHSSYITQTLLGNDTSGEYPIYLYDLNPQLVNDPRREKKLPKIIIHANIHGEEKGSAISLSHFLYDLANNWNTNSLLEWIRWNVHLIVVPLSNPYGFDRNSKFNVNGVDLNRNFEYNWEKEEGGGSSDPGDKFYKGTAPFSEVETQYIRDIISDNLDALAFYDLHMNGLSGDDWRQSYWTVLKDFPDKYGYTEMQKIATTDISRITREGHKRFNIPADSGFLGFITYDNPATSTTYAFSKGIPSSTIECTKKFVGEENAYSFKSMQLNTEMIGNKILTTVRNLIV